MIYRKASLADLPAIIEIGRRFWEQTEYHKAGMEYSEDRAGNMAKMAIESGITIISETDGYIHGMMLCIVHPAAFSDGMVCTDLAFYVSPEGRKSGVGTTLLGMTEALAIEKGCRMIVMVSLQSVDPKESEALFGKMGYRHAESSYLLVI